MSERDRGARETESESEDIRDTLTEQRERDRGAQIKAEE